MLAAHRGLKVDRESRMRTIEWLDLDRQACDDLFPNKPEEREIGGAAMADLRDHAKQLFGDEFAGVPDRALVNPPPYSGMCLST